MVAKRAKSINNHKVKKFFQYIFLFVFCSLVSVGAKAQALLAEEVTIQRQMEEVKTIALRNMLLNEVNTVPSADMYPECI